MPKLSRVLTAGLLVVLSCTPEQPRFAFKHAEKRGKLTANDMRFVLMPDPSTPLVNVAVRWDVGSREDPPGKAGLAHVVEHLMFQPRPDGNNSPPLFQSIANLAVGGDLNAYTSEDTTHYYETVRGENMDDAIKIEAMRQFYFFDTITEVEFERERDVVRNEIRQRGGTAEGQIDQLMLDAIYPKGHAYANTTGGNDAQLSSITLEDAKTFVKNYYAPERATVLIAGGFDPDVAVKSMEKWFGKIPKRAASPRVAVQPITMQPSRGEFELDVDRPMVEIAFQMPAYNTREGEAVQFGINRVFGRTLRAAQEYDFATAIRGRPLGGQLAPVFCVEIELKSLSNLDEALDWVKKNTKTAYQGFDMGSKVNLEEEGNAQKAEFITQLEPLGARTNLVGDLVQFGREVNFDSSELYVFHELDKYSKFDGDFVVKTIKQYLDFDKAKIFVVKASSKGIKGDSRTSLKFDKQKDEAIVDADVDPADAMRPIQIKAELKNLTGAEHIKLDNGMNVIMLPIHAMPVISAALLFRDVGSASTPNNPALARVAANFLSLPINEDAENDAVRKTGVFARCSVDPDDMICTTNGVSIYLDVMMKELERIVSNTDYSQDRVEDWQKQTKNQFGTKTAQERLEFRRQILTAFYGADHPYTVTALVTPDVASKVHKDALDEFGRSHYSAGNATLIVVGDFDPKNAADLARSVFGHWSSGSPHKPVGKATAKRAGPVYVGVVAKEEPQISLAMGYPAPPGIDGQQAARDPRRHPPEPRRRRPVQARHDVRNARRAREPARTDHVSDRWQHRRGARRRVPQGDPRRHRCAAERREFRRRLRARPSQGAARPARRLDRHRRDRVPARDGRELRARRQLLPDAAAADRRDPTGAGQGADQDRARSKQRGHHRQGHPRTDREDVRRRRHQGRQDRGARLQMTTVRRRDTRGA